MSSTENKKWLVDDLERFVFTKLWVAYQNSPNTRWANFDDYDEENEENKEWPPLDLLAITLEDLEKQGIVELEKTDYLAIRRKTYGIYRARLTNKGVRFIEKLIQDNSPKRPIGFSQGN